VGSWWQMVADDARIQVRFRAHRDRIALANRRTRDVPKPGPTPSTAATEVLFSVVQTSGKPI
jgi:hypothetical protein